MYCLLWREKLCRCWVCLVASRSVTRDCFEVRILSGFEERLEVSGEFLLVGGDGGENMIINRIF